jgi:hypothetical protein
MRRGGGCEQMHAKVVVSPTAPVAMPVAAAPKPVVQMQVQRQS